MATLPYPKRYGFILHSNVTYPAANTATAAKANVTWFTGVNSEGTDLRAGYEPEYKPTTSGMRLTREQLAPTIRNDGVNTPGTTGAGETGYDLIWELSDGSIRGIAGCGNGAGVHTTPIPWRSTFEDVGNTGVTTTFFYDEAQIVVRTYTLS